jgi:hypothetical protein
MSTPAAPVTTAPKPKGFFAKVAGDIVTVAKDVKNFFVKAAAETPSIAAAVATYGQEAQTLITSIDPQATSIVQDAITAAGGLADVLEAGGSAAESNLLNQGLDQSVITAVKSFASTVKGFAGSSTPAIPASAAKAAPAK